MRKIKILYAITKAQWGGAQKYVFDLATNLPREHYDIQVAVGGEGALIGKLEEQNIKVHQLVHLGRDINLAADLRSLTKLWWVCWRERPDVLHVNSAKLGGLGALVGRLVGVRNIIFTAHGWPFREERPAWQQRLIKFFSWLTIMLSHRVIVIAKTEYDAVKNWRWAEPKLRLISNGLTTTPLLNRALARDIIGQNLPYVTPPQALWMGTIAELHPNKGLAYGIEALALVQDQAPELVWFIIGAGERAEELQQLIETKGLEKKIFLLGRINEGARLLRAFDLALLPSIKEGLPYFVLEAGAAGLATIASAVGGVAEIIDHGESGLLAPAKNVRALARALVTLAHNQAERQRLGANLQRTVQERFSLEAMVGKTVRVYNS